MEAAGLSEYEFIAVLDHRTSQRCQSLDGTIHLLEEYDVGTNAPPMHPRCRSTISAVIEGGKRTAKGKNIKIPAEMKYPEFKAVYLDKSITFEQWQEGKATRLITGSSNDKIKTALTPLQQKIKAAEDTAFKAVGEDFGFKKLNREPNWATEISYVNGDGKGLERMMNCQRCALALEARMRRYDVIARPSYGATDEMRTVAEWLKVFNYSPSEIKKCTGKTGDEVIKSAEEIIRSFGEGARAVIWFKWSKNSGYRDGHVIIGECRKNGIVNISDPQTKEIAAAYKLKMADFDSIGILRVDNLEFTDWIKRCCKNRGEGDGNT